MEEIKSIALTEELKPLISVYKDGYEKKLETAKVKYTDLIYEVKTDDGRKLARKDRKEINAIVKSLDMDHKAMKEPFQDAVKLIDSTRKNIKESFNIITTAISGQLIKHDQLMTCKLASIEAYSKCRVGGFYRTDELKEMIGRCKSIVIDESYCDKQVEAEVLKEQALEALNAEYKTRKHSEEIEAENKRLREEAEQRAIKEREEEIRREAEQKAREEAEQKAEKERQDIRHKLELETLQRERKEREEKERVAAREAEANRKLEEAKQKQREAEEAKKQVEEQKERDIEEAKQQERDRIEAIVKEEEEIEQENDEKQRKRDQINADTDEEELKIQIAFSKTTTSPETTTDSLISHVSRIQDEVYQSIRGLIGKDQARIIMERLINGEIKHLYIHYSVKNGEEK